MLHKIKKIFCDLFSSRKRNEKINNLEFKKIKTELTSTPPNIIIGINNICNLRCPLCVTGIKKQKKSMRSMELEFFREIIDKIEDKNSLVQLYNWGEPLLHKDLGAMLEYCNKFDLNTQISSNLCVENSEDKLEMLVKHRLKSLIVSFDGVNQEDYERYRVGGDFQLVLDSIKIINVFRDKYKSPFPKITLQYLRNKFTTNQVEIIKKNHKEWGADNFIVYNMTTVFKDLNRENHRKWFTDEEIDKRKYMDIDVSMHGKVCYFLYTTMIIEQDGSLPPCCFSTDPADDFGHWDKSRSITEMYNSEKYVAARKMFQTRKADKDIVCSNCPVFITYCDKHKKTGQGNLRQ